MGVRIPPPLPVLAAETAGGVRQENGGRGEDKSRRAGAPGKRIFAYGAGWEGQFVLEARPKFPARRARGDAAGQLAVAIGCLVHDDCGDRDGGFFWSVFLDYGFGFQPFVHTRERIFPTQLR